MSEVKSAVITASAPLIEGIHRISLQSEAPHGFRPGQYVIARSALPHPEKAGEQRKRAWSAAEILDDHRFTMVVATVGETSRWLSDQPVGETLCYTGPWGRFQLDKTADPACFFATGTGLSPVGALLDAALAQGRPCTLWWQVDQPYDEARLSRWENAGARLHIGPAVQVDEARPASWFLAGNGAIIENLIPNLRGPIYTERFYTPRPTP